MSYCINSSDFIFSFNFGPLQFDSIKHSSAMILDPSAFSDLLNDSEAVNGF